MWFAVSEKKFDIILTGLEKTSINGTEMARLIRDIEIANSNNAIIASSGDTQRPPHNFDALIEAHRSHYNCRIRGVDGPILLMEAPVKPN